MIPIGASYSIVANNCFFAGTGWAISNRERVMVTHRFIRAVMFLYDCLITTGDEITCFWGKKLTGAAILFWVNKYINILFMVWSITSYFKISDVVCALDRLVD